MEEDALLRKQKSHNRGAHHILLALRLNNAEEILRAAAKVISHKSYPVRKNTKRATRQQLAKALGIRERALIRRDKAYHESLRCLHTPEKTSDPWRAQG